MTRRQLSLRGLCLLAVMSRACCSVTLLAASACSAAPTQHAAVVSPQQVQSDDAIPRIEPWPLGDQGFHSNVTWLGADSAYSVDLDTLRVLWLFADTFLDPARDGSRTNGPNLFVRNSVAIQSGATREAAHDLSHSQFQFYWGDAQPGGAASFFHDRDGSEHWLWPLHGARLPSGELLLFRMHVSSEPTGLGFRIDGWDAVAIDDPGPAPSGWHPRPLREPGRTRGLLLGSWVLPDSGFLYVYGVDDTTPDHAIYLARFPLSELTGLRAGALDDPAWWTGTARGFVRESELTEHVQPAALLHAGQVEFSVHYEPARKRFVHIQMSGMFASDPQTQISWRTALKPEGPWSAPVRVFTPAEHSHPRSRDLIAYAAKAHPEQLGADMVLTYVANDLKQFPPNDGLYYPQSLRGWYSGDAPNSQADAALFAP